MKKTLLLVDGNAVLYRAYHAFPKEFTTPDGRPSGATFGFARILMTAVRTLKPTHLVVSFDAKGGTFRDELLEQYKAQRAPMPDDLKQQVPMVWQLVDAWEAPRFVISGFEADDTVGTIATKAVEADPDLHVIIMSGDQDMIQLVTDRISMYSPAAGFAKAALYSPEKVVEKYGFEPLQMIDYKALRGDSSDNIPGVPGIGEVTGKQLINEFHTLDGIYDALEAGKTDKIKPAVLKKLTEHRELAYLSYKVATIIKDVPLDFDLKKCELRVDTPENIASLYREFGFRSLITELPTSHRLATEAADVFGSASNTDLPSPAPTAEKPNDLDANLEPVLRAMEARGITIDLTYFKALENEFTEEIADISASVFDLAGQSFNLDSPQQLGHILYTVLNIPTTWVRKGKTGFTTDADTLTRLAPEFPICAKILAYREYSKLLSTYIKPLPTMVDGDNRLHTTYAPDTATGRISSKNPNLQNIPTKTELGKRIRRGFIPQKGWTLLAADYSQIELRVAAHLSGDETMIKAFNSGTDFHSATAERMGVDRRVAKIINFSILYGKSAFTFAQDLSISVEAAKLYIDQYFATYPKLRTYIDSVVEFAKTHGYTETLSGRRRYFPELKTGPAIRRAAAEREAVNHPIQGTAAEILKQAMIDLAPLLSKRDDVHLLLTVHDELVLEVAPQSLTEIAAMVNTTMKNAVKLVVPTVVDVESGPNWTDLTEVK